MIDYWRKEGKKSNVALQKTFLNKDEKIFMKIVKRSGVLRKILHEGNSKTTGSILSVMMSYLKNLEILQDTNSDLFSIRDWVGDSSQKGCLFLTSRADQHETLKPLISVYMETSINSLLSVKQRSSKTWIFLDELPSLHYLPSLQSGLAESRQFGGSFVLSLQLMAQLRDIYGRDKAESVSGLCRNRVVFSTPDEETANWCAGSLGKIEEENLKENFSYGANDIRDGVNLNRHTQVKNAIYPIEIMNLPDLHCYIRFSSGFALAKSILEYKFYEEIASAFVEGQEKIKIDLLDTETVKKPQDNLKEQITTFESDSIANFIPAEEDIIESGVLAEEDIMESDVEEMDESNNNDNTYNNF